MDKHLRLWGAGQHQQSVQVSLGFVLGTSVSELSSEAPFPPSLFQLISSVRGLPSVQKPFPLSQLPPRGTGPVLIPFFIFSILLPFAVMRRFSCFFESLSSGIVQ